MSLKAPYFTFICVIRESLSILHSLLYFPCSLSIICSLTLFVPPICLLCVYVSAVCMPLDTFAIDYGMTQMPVIQGASPVANCTYFQSQDLQMPFGVPPHL